MQESVSIGRAAIMLGVSISTLRRWHAEGRLIPVHHHTYWLGASG
jgi:DNA-binding transcriptional MerR regulator